eukprot:6491730-Amphidinium_carterae.4
MARTAPILTWCLLTGHLLRNTGVLCWQALQQRLVPLATQHFAEIAIELAKRVAGVTIASCVLQAPMRT